MTNNKSIYSINYIKIKIKIFFFVTKITRSKLNKTRTYTQNFPFQKFNQVFVFKLSSWVTNSSFSGGGFVFDLEPGSHTYGSIGMRQTPSPLHAEFNILLCAMKSSLQIGYTSMSFQSDCLQLVKLINEEEDWPSLASEWNEFTFLVSEFNSFSISFIARSINVRADLLAKGARLQNSLLSHVNSLIPTWLASQANLFVLN
ncbi:hypothetical protein Bca52824_009954 [Brassica carinata]|uniref:RNase H type-1 domain-containing protein n=1 Tax=Brassica carinata TaxID=52824 RepID=A0A8X7WBU6_BRACI|nr:hypothetical protein Bca52824_009954 [Brassica carinata]